MSVEVRKNRGGSRYPISGVEMDWVENTKDLIKRHSLDAEIIEHKWWGKESEGVSEKLGVPLKNVIKGLVCIFGRNFVLAMICGDDRLNLDKLSKMLGTEAKLARAKDLEAIGFEVGGVPAIGSRLKTVVDKKVLERDFIIGSAGSPYAGIRMRPSDLVRLNDALVDDIAE